MLRVVTSEARVGMLHQIRMERLVSYLRKKGYPAIIRGMFTGMFRSAKLPDPQEQLIAEILRTSRSALIRHRYRERMRFLPVVGDFFVTDDIVYALNPSGPEILRASAIGYEKQNEALQDFCTNVKEGIRAKFKVKVDWSPLSYGLPSHRHPPFAEISEEEHKVKGLRLSEPDYSSEDVKAAYLLLDADIRRFMLRLAKVGKMRCKDAISLVKKKGVLQRLLSLGLIAEEYLLTCRQDQHTICVVSSKDNLTREPKASLRCSVCSRSFDKENLQVIYTLTERGKRLITGSLWMSVWFTDLLRKNGIRSEGIKWSMEASGEELDIVVDDFGSRLLFELKDREFGLGDAYPFSFRVTRYGGELGVVVTTDKVSTDAKKFLEDESFVEIECLEGSENTENGIKKIVEDRAFAQVREVIGSFSERLGIDLWPIAKYWIAAKTK